MIPAPTVSIPLTAAELRALAGVHDTFAEASSVCGLHPQAAEGWDRAALLRRMAERLGPPADGADGLLGVDA